MTFLKIVKELFSKKNSIRILRICPSPGHLTKFRSIYSLDGMSHSKQIEALQNNNIFLPGSWATEMKKLGCTVFDSLYDDEDLVRKWAEENNYLHAYTQTNPKFDILLKQAEIFKPNIVIFWTGGLYKVDRYHRKFLRQVLPNALFIVVWGDEIPANETYNSYFGDLDFAFAINKSYCDNFKKNGIPSIPFGSSFDTTLVPKKTLSIDSRKHDLIMCGDTGYMRNDHINRYLILSQLIQKTSLKVFATEPDTNSNNSCKEDFFYNKLSLKSIRPLQVFEGPVDARDYYQLLNESKISINVHRDESIDYGNLRCFEACGSGSVLLTDRSNKVSDFYDVETSIEKLMQDSISAEAVGFDSLNDCIQKIDFLLNNTEVMQKISDNAIEKTKRFYTVQSRSKFMFKILSNLLSEHKITKVHKNEFTN